MAVRRGEPRPAQRGDVDVVGDSIVRSFAKKTRRKVEIAGVIAEPRQKERRVRRTIRMARMARHSHSFGFRPEHGRRVEEQIAQQEIRRDFASLRIVAGRVVRERS